jgi:predicted RND superfamily exporter protein
MKPGFGLHRVGMLSLAWPRLVLCGVALITALAGLSGWALEYSSDIRQIYQTDTPNYHALERLESAFTTSDQDVYIVMALPTPMDAEAVGLLRRFHLDLMFADGVQNVLSLFSLRAAPDGAGHAPPLIPDDLASVPNMARLIQGVVDHPLNQGRLIGKDGRTLLFVVSLETRDLALDPLATVVEGIRQQAQGVARRLGTEAFLTGIAPMRIEIVGALHRDQIVFSIVGVAVGLVVCFLFFGTLMHVIIVGIPAACAAVWSLLAIHATGGTVNFMNNVIPVLGLVIAFADGVHMLHAIERGRASGADTRNAIAKAVGDVGPACVLTSLTTALALASIGLAPEALISEFALAAGMAVILAYLAMILSLPALALLLLAPEPEPVPGPVPGPGPGPAPKGATSNPLRSRSLAFHTQSQFADKARALSMINMRHARATVALGVCAMVTLGCMHSFNKPTYRYQSNLPQSSEAYLGMQIIDDALAGSNQLEILAEFPTGSSALSVKGLEILSAVETAVQTSFPVGGAVLSFADLETWWRDGHRSREQFLTASDALPGAVLDLFVARNNNAARVTVPYADIDSAALLPRLDALERQLETIEAEHDGLDLTVTGISPVSAMAGHQMVERLSWSLLGAIATIILLIAVFFRSLRLAVVSILPNVLPLAMAGAMLFVLGDGLRLTSVVAFTIAFGIAVDDTVHVLNAYRTALHARLTSEQAIARAIHQTGPVLIVSTLVLSAGMSGLLLSQMPALQVYALVCIAVFVAALACDLIILPALLALFAAPQSTRPKPGRRHQTQGKYSPRESVREPTD